jgi:hypothetical protein
MRDLRIVGRSDDGESLELHDLDGNSFTLRISDHLKSLVNQPTSYTLRSVTLAENGEITIKEIQSRLRGGESMESIAESGNVSLEKVERYSHPILQERSYIISLAQKAELKKLKVSLLEAVTEKLSPRGVEMKSCEWNTYRNEDGTWQVLLRYPTRDGEGRAEWRFETVKRRIDSDDDGARWIMGEESVVPESSVRPLRSQETPPKLVSIRSTPTMTPVSPILDEDPDDESVDELDLEMDLDDSGTIPADARRDGVTRKVSIPSWDDIMFGVRKDDPSTPN